MERQVVIDVQDVTKVFKLEKGQSRKAHKAKVPKVANDHISLQICRNEAVAVFGRNGSGKSTLLKQIAVVSFPTEGSITVNGNISALLELGAGFEPEYTGRENIYLRGMLAGMTKQETAAIEQGILDFAQLGDYADRPLRTYSSGMKARLGFALSVALVPDVLIVDEALSVGDALFQAKCLKTVREIKEKEGVTFILVTHSTRVARDFCERGVVLEAGRLVFDGAVEEAIRYYEEDILHLAQGEHAEERNAKRKKSIFAAGES